MGVADTVNHHPGQRPVCAIVRGLQKRFRILYGLSKGQAAHVPQIQQVDAPVQHVLQLQPAVLLVAHQIGQVPQHL